MDMPPNPSGTPLPVEGDEARDAQRPPKLLFWLCLALGLPLAGVGVVWLVTIVGREQDAAAAIKNVKRVTLAMLDYAEKNGGVLPAQALYDGKTGKPLLSWRVAILPQLGELALYEEIRLDEPWDSPHNRRLWGRMPKAYELPGLPASGGMTVVQVFTGPGTPFSGRKGRKHPQGFPDGCSWTILVAEAATPVNWMEPADIDIASVDLEDVRASLGNRTGKGPVMGLADGYTHFLPEKRTNDILKTYITPDRGDTPIECWW